MPAGDFFNEWFERQSAELRLTHNQWLDSSFIEKAEAELDLRRLRIYARESERHPGKYVWSVVLPSRVLEYRSEVLYPSKIAAIQAFVDEYVTVREGMLEKPHLEARAERLMNIIVRAYRLAGQWGEDVVASELRPTVEWWKGQSHEW